MMGAGIAYSCARAGMQVVLKDVEQASADKGKAYSEKILAKAVERGKMDQSKMDEILGRITATTEAADFAGVDLVIEAVFEDPSLKAKVFGEIQDVVEPRRPALLEHLDAADHRAGPRRRPSRRTSSGCTSSAPSTRCRWWRSSAASRPPTTPSPSALDVVMAIRKTPIVVNDSRGFYTSRVIGTMVNEGLAMLGEGVHPMSVERAATQAGYPVGTLQLSDELNMELMAKIAQGHRERRGRRLRRAPRHRRGGEDARGRSSGQAARRRLLRLRRERSPHLPVVRA